MVSKKKKKVRAIKFILNTRNTCLGVTNQEYFILVFNGRRCPVYDQKGCAQKATVVSKRF